MSRVTLITFAAALTALLAGPVAATAGQQSRLLVMTEDGEVAVVSPGPGISTAAALAELRSDPDVVVAEPDRPISIAATDDPLFKYQWALDNPGVFAWSGVSMPGADIDVFTAWRDSLGADVAVAVADTGVDDDHPDLDGALEPGWDYEDDDADPYDFNGHGTHVTGVIAARSGNGKGIAGVAPEARVVALRILDGDGTGSTSDEVAAFSDAAGDGVKIVNASFGSGSYSAAEDLVIRANPKTLFVVAAGNLGLNLDLIPKFPCALNYDNVICVGASTPDDRRALFSDFGGKHVDLFAPGQDIASTWPQGSYALESGTSMAAPMVSGVAALVAARQPSLDAGQIRRAIVEGVDRPAALQSLSSSGGRLNAAGALAAADRIAAPQPPPPSPPAQTPVAAAAEDAPRIVKPPAPATSPSAKSGKVVGVAVRGSARTRASKAVVSFRMTGAAAVKIVLERRTCKSGRCRWQQRVTWSVAAVEGLRKVSLRTRTPRSGDWRVTVSTGPADRRSARFRVSGR